MPPARSRRAQRAPRRSVPGDDATGRSTWRATRGRPAHGVAPWCLPVVGRRRCGRRARAARPRRLRALDALAARDHRTRSEVIRAAIDHELATA
ncbi:ribbon-helix-helix protein, CopG family [Cellulomonas hominis]|nr:ribbon-helix-helix protein, CopG family [Cellulomonas hominis]